MTALYKTSVMARGGRNGHVRSDDGALDLSLALPAALGGKGGASNPEQLFAAGYAACFGNAVIHVSRGQTDKVHDDDVDVVGAVGLVSNGQGGFGLTITLTVTITGLSQEAAEEVVHAAHAVCPYSNAIKNNIDVELIVLTK